MDKLLLKCGEFEKPHKWGCEEKRIRRRKYKKGRKKTSMNLRNIQKKNFTKTSNQEENILRKGKERLIIVRNLKNVNVIIAER